jgi:hypothetical protein
MGVVVIRHIELKYPLPFNYSSLYIWGTVTEVSLEGEVSRWTNNGKGHERWINKNERSAQGTPQKCIHANDSINVTKRTPSGSWNKGRTERTHRRGTTRNFRIAIQANTISPIMADPTRAIHV